MHVNNELLDETIPKYDFRIYISDYILIDPRRIIKESILNK